MHAYTRRRFLRDLLIGTQALYLGCSMEGGDGQALEDAGDFGGSDGGSDQGSDGGPDLGSDRGLEDAFTDPADAHLDGGLADQGLDPTCPDLTGGTFIDTLPFSGEAVTFHVPVNTGWDGRLFTDLSLINPDRLITPTAEFFIRTLFPDRLDLAARMPWRIRVQDSDDLLLDDLLPQARPMGAHVLECSGNSRGRQFGLLSACEWTGIPLSEILDRLPQDAPLIEVSGFDDHSTPSANNHSTPGASWIFTRDQLRHAFLATAMNGAPLPLDHGFPTRLIVPGWYGCTAIKWVDALRFHDIDAPATAQMREFASRTHQNGTPALARDYRPAALDQAAMPIRIERWQVDGGEVLRVIGILWGGQQTTGRLSIRLGEGAFEPVAVCPPLVGNALWTVFEHIWRPTRRGEHVIRCAIEGVPTRRLDTGYYDRAVVV
jgi:DMSO/TMAO reductase YedYZ molybdopterin-dependent catalytic subunit